MASLRTFFVVLLCVSSTVGLHGCATTSTNDMPAAADTRTTDVMIVEASCGQCQFGLPGRGCDLAVRIDGDAYYVDGTGIDDLRETLIETAAGLPLMGEKWPEAWLNAANAVRAHPERHVTPHELFAVLAEHEVADENADILAQWLHDLGDILYYRDEEDINDTVREAISVLRPSIARHGVELTTRMATDLPPVDIDRIQIQQVVLNLVRNAIDALAGAAVKEIHVSTRLLQTGQAQVAVRDIQVVVEYTDNTGRVQQLRRNIGGRLEPGEIARADTGLGPYSGADCPVRVVAARVAE